MEDSGPSLGIMACPTFPRIPWIWTISSLADAGGNPALSIVASVPDKVWGGRLHQSYWAHLLREVLKKKGKIFFAFLDVSDHLKAKKI